MRVFVTGTGRCGSVTFWRACTHIKNYTSGHESLVGPDSVGLWSYPDNHIEIAPQLAIAIPILRKKYPDSKWIHLIRSKSECVESLSKEAWLSMQAFSYQWFLASIPSNSYSAAEAFYEAVNTNIEALIPSDSIEIYVRDRNFSQMPSAMTSQWSVFWSFINAKGDFEASLSEWGKKYNAAECRGKNSYKDAQGEHYGCTLPGNNDG